MANILERIRNDIFAAIKAVKIVLPTLPEVALQVREVAQSDNSTVPDLVKVLSTDAALTARVIKVANSPLMRGVTTIETLPNAVSRLGMSYSANLAVGLAMQQMYQATSEVIDTRMREVWSKSTEIAGICHVLCSHYTKLKPDQATLAGLTHRIGALPILTYAEEHEELLVDERKLDIIIEKLHPSIGDLILKTWDFNEELVQVPRQYLNFKRKSEQADYVDLVMVANLQTYINTEHRYAQLDWNAIPAFSQLGLDPEVDVTESEDLSGDMEAAMALLQ